MKLACCVIAQALYSTRTEDVREGKCEKEILGLRTKGMKNLSRGLAME